MKNSTHYLFSLGMTNLYLLIGQDRDPGTMGFSIFLSLVCSFVSLLPNYTDNYVSISMGVQISRSRHPLSHSPWTIAYFLPLLYLSEVIELLIFQILASLITISWCSHLLLDLLNPGGIPIGKKPIFNNHAVKHYQFMINGKRHKSIRLARIPFNDIRANRNLGYIGLFLFSLNIATLFLKFLRGV